MIDFMILIFLGFILKNLKIKDKKKPSVVDGF